MKTKFKLGDEVEDLISGYKGIIVGKTVFLNGCIQYMVSGKWKSNEVPKETPCFDEASLKLIRKKAFNSIEYKEEDEEPKEERDIWGGRTGGPTTFQKRNARGF